MFDQLRDAFSSKGGKDLTQDAIEANVKVGALLKADILKKAGHHKIFIIVGIRKSEELTECAYVFVNSESNENVFSSQQIEDGHLEIKCPEDDNIVLRYTSTVNCYDVFTIDRNKIVELLKKTGSDYPYCVSKISPKLLSDIISTIKKIGSMKGKLINKFGMYEYLSKEQ